MLQPINHIVIRDGQAYIERKPHLKAEMVARMYTDGDYTIEDVMAQYGLAAAEVHAALAYYYDNRTALDASHERAVAEIQENAMTLEKLKAKLTSKNTRDELS